MVNLVLNPAPVGEEVEKGVEDGLALLTHGVGLGLGIRLGFDVGVRV
jgi:hypothetical protein